MRTLTAGYETTVPASVKGTMHHISYTGRSHSPAPHTVPAHTHGATNHLMYYTILRPLPYSLFRAIKGDISTGAILKQILKVIAAAAIRKIRAGADHKALRSCHYRAETKAAQPAAPERYSRSGTGHTAAVQQHIHTGRSYGRTAYFLTDILPL
jgi:hypothetical protein